MMKKNVWHILVLGLVAFFAINMGEGGKYGSRLLEPSFAKLEEGQGSISGVVFDENTRSHVRDLSFYGQTSVGGVRRESDDSVNKLDMVNLAELRVVNASYQSSRFSDKEVILVEVKTKKGTMIKDLLIPKHVVICGVEEKTLLEKAWFINKINKIVLVPQKVLDLRKEPIKQDIKKQMMPVKEEKKSVWNSLLGIVDSFIDFIRSIFNFFFSLIGF